MLMATRSSDLDDQKYGVIIQTEGHTLTPLNGQNGLEEREASGSTPHSPSQSLVRRQTPDFPETQYCLEIHAISTKDRGATPPPPHAWQVPVAEEMLWDGKSGLTNAVVKSPGQAILFYGRQSVGEGLSLGEVDDAMFMLSEAISWVSKQAQLNANTVHLWEGWRMITQTITEWQAEPRGPGCPHTHLLAFAPFNFWNQDEPLQEERLPSADECMEEPRHICQTSHHDQGWIPHWGWDHGQMQWGPWTAQLPHLHLHQITGLKGTEVQCQLPHWCNPGLICLEAPGIHTMADAKGSLETIWKSTCWSSRTRTWKMPSLIKVGIWTKWCINKLDAEITPFSLMLSAPYKVIQGSWSEV